ncbi:MAG: hypothetical protein IT323_16285 [Anaerolineae bacterium]|nr:hypothetical protein [Anaerolineae bacterium]
MSLINPIRSWTRIVLAACLFAALFAQLAAPPPARADGAQWYIYQQFERGLMLTNGMSITALVDPDKAYDFPKLVYEGVADVPFSGAPPSPQLHQPSGAFGKLWRALPDLRNSLGWAIGAEIPYQATVGAAMGTYISLPDTRTVKINLGVLSPGSVPFNLAYGGTVTATYGAWTYTNSGATPCTSAVQRIRFAPGAVSGTVSGVIGAACNPSNYVLRALAGQRMIINLQGQGPLAGVVRFSDGSAYNFGIATNPEGISFDRGLPLTGDYAISISTQNLSVPSSYVMTVTVVNQTGGTPVPCDTTTRHIQFAAGAYSATVNGYSSLACPRASYVLRARAGQRMVVSVSSGGPMIGMVIVPNGGLQSGYANTAAVFDSILPVTGDYTIQLEQDTRYAGWEGQYSMTVSVY